MLQDLLASITKLDQNIYLTINQAPHPWWLNSFFLLFDYLTYAGVIWIIFCLGLIIFGKTKNNKILGVMGLAIVFITTFFEGLIIKTLIVRRLRPFITFPNALRLGATPSTFSFPSGQASNVFAVSAFFALFFKKKNLTLWFFLFSTIVAFGRIYLGNHYPTDVLAGVVIGIIIGLVIFSFFNKSKWSSIVSPKEKTV